MGRRSLDTTDLDREPDPLPIELTASIVTPADGPVECTLYPVDVPDDAVVTTWLTALEGSFVSLERAR